MTQTVLITGANGGLGRLMRPRLAREGRTLRLLDLVTPEPPPTARTWRCFRGR